MIVLKTGPRAESKDVSDGKKWPNKHAHCVLVPGGLIIQKTEEMFEAK